MASLFSDFLTALGVRHTEKYSDKRFAEMPFHTMFGLSSLLKEYGVSCAGVTVPSESKARAMSMLPIPFLADTPDGFAIVTKISGRNVTYQTQHRFFTAPVEELASGWNGIALLASASSASIEPEYRMHRMGEIGDRIKGWVLGLLAVCLLAYAMYVSGLYSHWAGWALLAIDLIGIWLSSMLVQKSLGFRTRAADAVCSVLEEGGCDEIARSEAASFMGIFKWSEVGLAYFTVSLAAMLLFPSTLPALAAINILCLPYTLWSIWYQRFKAKTWCTLCVSVQCALWLLFGVYMLGGFTGRISAQPTFFTGFIVLGCCYVAVMLGLNRIDSLIVKHIKPDDDETDAVRR